MAISLSNATIDSCIFVDNIVARGVVVGGGAVAAWHSNLTLQNSSFLRNSAFANGSCVNLDGNGLKCPSSFGGSVVLSNVEVAQFQNCTFSENSCNCRGSFATGCTVKGAALSVSGSASDCQISSSMFFHNVANCSSLNGCKTGHGGAIYGDSGVAIVDLSLFQNNSASGIGSGGAIAALNAFVGYFNHVGVFSNSARQGGYFFFCSCEFFFVEKTLFGSNLSLYPLENILRQNSKKSAFRF